jgi:D-alanine-D-alanine ligase
VITIAVIFGGRSGEHQVSCSSAASIMANLDPDRYDVVPMRIETDGTWTIDDRPGTGDISHAVAALRRVDVAFPALHGRYGEDGTIQSMLQYVGVPYVGNGVLPSTTGMDKEHTKRLLAADGLRVTADVVLRRGADDIGEADRERLGLPVFVKPATGGSSLGVSKVGDWADLPAAVRAARDSEARTGDAKVIVEAAVHGREIDLGVLEHPDGRLAVGPPLEIRVAGGHTFFDYEAKYQAADTIFDIPARLDEAMANRLRDRAVQVFRAMECGGLLRVDFFLPHGEDEPVVNEINTFPGFTIHSQYPQMWRAAGLDYPALVDLLVATALAKAANRAALPAAG